jgi:hypothetical protein
VHLPPDVLEFLPPGTYLRVVAQSNGSALLVPASSSSGTVALAVEDSSTTRLPVQSVPSQWNAPTRYPTAPIVGDGVHPGRRPTDYFGEDR